MRDRKHNLIDCVSSRLIKKYKRLPLAWLTGKEESEKRVVIDTLINLSLLELERKFINYNKYDIKRIDKIDYDTQFDLIIEFERQKHG